MQSEIKIALVQAPLVWQNPTANKIYFEKKIRAISKGVVVIILPEMFTTGFTMTPEVLPFKHGLQALDWMKQLSTEVDAAIVGSIVYNEEGKIYNRLFFVTPDGNTLKYDKRHTFNLAGEGAAYTAGKDRLLVDYKGFRFCPLICYDLRFPVWSRNTDNYDVLIYVANWPTPRIKAWDILLKARAIENCAYAIGVNRVGTDENNLTYNGHSAVYDMFGKELAYSEKEVILEVVLSKTKINTMRSTFKFLDDKDTFTIIN